KEFLRRSFGPCLANLDSLRGHIKRRDQERKRVPIRRKGAGGSELRPPWDDLLGGGAFGGRRRRDRSGKGRRQQAVAEKADIDHRPPSPSKTRSTHIRCSDMLLPSSQTPHRVRSISLLDPILNPTRYKCIKENGKAVSDDLADGRLSTHQGTRKHLTPFPEVTGTEPYIPVTASIPTTSDRTATLSPCSALFFPLDSVPWRRGS
ncbi:hypothetical protein B296_00052515, partial [Ensete ventricosum]